MGKFKVGDVITSAFDEGIDITPGAKYVVHSLPDDDHDVVFKDNAGSLRWRPADRYCLSNDGPCVPGARKDDGGKLDMNLLDDMPRAVKAVVEVMQWAIVDKKPVPYVRGSWLGVEPDRYRAAIKRHERSAAEQATADVPARFQRDPETNLLHLAHTACSAMMALENALREQEAKT